MKQLLINGLLIFMLSACSKTVDFENKKNNGGLGIGGNTSNATTGSTTGTDGGTTTGSTTSGTTTGSTTGSTSGGSGHTTGGDTGGGTGGGICPPEEKKYATCELYDLPVGTSSLPDFNSLTPVAYFIVPKFDITHRDWQNPFPYAPASYTRREWYAIRCLGTIKVPATKVYTFTLITDDGAKVYLNNQLVVGIDGVQPVQTVNGSYELTHGLYTLELQWFQGPKTFIALELFWEASGLPKTHVTFQ